MAHNKRKFVIWLGVAALATGAMVGCKKKPQTPPAEPNNAVKQQQTLPPASNPTPTLSSIIARRRGWGTAYTNWYGKQSPDFTVTDIDGKQHRLSEYRGKNVILNFWATWCGPCRIEIPHLIELRKTISEDKLTMLAISYIDLRNSAETIKKFVAANPIINYTVTATDMESMPEPYNYIDAIPCSFFIDPQGRIKLATEGVIGLQDMKAIIAAEQ